jgi:hypothetical protein
MRFDAEKRVEGNAFHLEACPPRFLACSLMTDRFHDSLAD